MSTDLDWVTRAITAQGASAEHAPVLLRFAQEILRWGKAMNLTGARSVRVLAEEHIADAVPLARCLAPASTLLDVGSGAGLPAMVLAVLRRDVSFTLLEKNHKKAVFLRTIARELGLSHVVAYDGEIDAPPAGMPRQFDAVTARAVFPPPEWVARGASWVAPGGVLFALLAELDTPSAPEGFTLAPAVEYRLANGATRRIAAYHRTPSSTH